MFDNQLSLKITVQSIGIREWAHRGCNGGIKEYMKPLICQACFYLRRMSLDVNKQMDENIISISSHYRVTLSCDTLNTVGHVGI